MSPYKAESGAATIKIFVYGTLKPGGRNYFLAKGVVYTETAHLEGYDLVHFERPYAGFRFGDTVF